MDIELDRQEEWPPTFTSDTTTVVLDRGDYETLGRPSQITVSVAAVAGTEDPAPEVPAEPEPAAADGTFSVGNTGEIATEPAPADPPAEPTPEVTP